LREKILNRDNEREENPIETGEKRICERKM
jgi:hypothetical protein